MIYRLIGRALLALGLMSLVPLPAMAQDNLARALANQAAATAAAPRNAFDGVKYKLARGLPASVLIVADSFGDPYSNPGMTVWPNHFAAFLAAKYPSSRVTLQQWNFNSGGAFDPVAVVQAGTGGPTITILSFGQGGSRIQGGLGSLLLRSGLKTFGADVIIVCHGNNHVNSDANVRGELLAGIETLSLMHPEAGVVWLTEAPRLSESASLAAVRNVIFQIAAQRGHSVADAFALFAAAGKPAGWYRDDIHPSATGQLLGMEPPLEALFNAAIARPAEPITSTLTPAPLNVSLIANSDFSAYPTSPGLPSNWLAGGAGTLTATKDTSIVDDPRLGYSVQLTSSTNTAYLYQNVDALTRAAILGKRVSFWVRRFVPDTATATAGRIALTYGGGADGTVVVRSPDYNKPTASGGWLWWGVSDVLIPSDATFVQVLIFHDAASGTPTSVPVNIAQAVLVAGPLPRAVR